MRLDLFCLGFVEYTVEEARGAEVFDAIRGVSVSLKAVKRCEKSGVFRFFCTLRGARQLMSMGLPVTEVRKGGIPMLARGLGRRPGLLCGIVLAVTMLIAARLFVWGVEIEGNEKLSREELLEELAAAGVARGTFLPRVDEEEVALALRRGDGRISYAALNLRGMVVRLQIRESVEQAPPEKHPADLVAARDGVIVLPLVFEGQTLVREGEVVRAGQVLAEGTLVSEKHGPRLTRAAGQIWARTVHTYRVSVPLSYTEKRETGEQKYTVELLFFGFRGKVFKNSGNYTEGCDIIQNIKWLTLPNGRELPVGLAVTAFRAYEEVAATRTATEALTLAQGELESRIAEDSTGRRMLSRTVETLADGDGITLLCTLVCEEDIAVVREIEAIPNEVGTADRKEEYGSGNHQDRQQ